MLMTWNTTDEFGHALDPNYRTELVGIAPATGWFACSKIEDTWYFDPLPQYMTVRRTDLSKPERSPRLEMFGVHEFLGELERVDISSQFCGYAHESEFEEIGVTLKPSAIARFESGEFMCGDPSRHGETLRP